MWKVIPVVVVYCSPSPNSQTYSSIIVGDGVLEDLASKLTDSPRLIDVRSALISAIGVVDAKPVHPAKAVNKRRADSDTARPACNPIMQMA